MTTQAPTPTAWPSDGGLMITHEMIVSRFMRTLLVFGREKAIELYDDYVRLLHPFPGWERTSQKLEDILIDDAIKHNRKQNCAPGELPDELSTDAAMILWQKVQEAGFVDENYQPLISRSQAAMLADAISVKLNIINNKWKLFEALWDRKNMYNDYYHALSQRKSLQFQDKLKKHFAD